MRELYTKLGFTEEESKLQGEEFQKVCKSKFRELSKKWHPDKWSNKSDEEKKLAEEKFKEINEANEILSNPDKRQIYDLTGSTDGNIGNGGGNPFGDGFPFGHGFNPFGDDFNPFGNKQRIARGDDATVEITITMEESYTGCRKEVNVERIRKCSHCNGTGSSDGKTTICPHCHGTGFIEKSSNRGNIFMTQRSICPHCGGTGHIISSPCKHCHGTGTEKYTEVEIIDIPAGIFDEAVMCLKGKGCEPIEGNGINGDLYIKFKVLPSPCYERINDDIIYNLELDLNEAWCGCEKSIYNVNGISYKIKVPELCKNGYKLRLRGKGFKNLNNGIQGDLIAKVVYKTPKKLTDDQKKLLNEFYDLENKK